jgi:tRNA(fMet)-specific endonuclease VapC
MPGFLLDTDTISFILRGQGNAGDRMFLHHPSKMFVSAITVAELEFGAARRKSAALKGRIDAFVKLGQVIPLDHAAAQRYGEVAAHLEQKGTPIGQFDTLIAAQALTYKLTLVTNNTKHYSRVPGLKLENWL